ncbi:MAG: hypothetical protein ACK40S_14615 [Burkholderiaceae bacterium]
MTTHKAIREARGLAFWTLLAAAFPFLIYWLCGYEFERRPALAYAAIWSVVLALFAVYVTNAKGP